MKNGNAEKREVYGTRKKKTGKVSRKIGVSVLKRKENPRRHRKTMIFWRLIIWSLFFLFIGFSLLYTTLFPD